MPADFATFKHRGDVVDYVAPVDITAGQVVPLGKFLAGVALIDIKAGKTGSVALEGVFECQSHHVHGQGGYAVGEKVYATHSETPGSVSWGNVNSQTSVDNNSWTVGVEVAQLGYALEDAPASTQAKFLVKLGR